MITSGGDPNAAFRIIRAARHHYENVEILISDRCKSAGTLMCIGSDKLIIGDRGELGPLDIQLSKPDEMFENMSGLAIIQALNLLQQQLLEAFRAYLIDIKAGSQVTTKTAAEIASKLTEGFISPITAKIDPVTLGEHQRAMAIALEYGLLLNDMTNIMKTDALFKLISSYPSHGFVIDRKEAKSLFKNVEAPNEYVLPIYIWSRNMFSNIPNQKEPIIVNTKLLSKSDDKSTRSAKKGKSDGKSRAKVSNNGQNDEPATSKSKTTK